MTTSTETPVPAPVPVETPKAPVRDGLVIWWERYCEQRRQELVPARARPADGAAWAAYVNFFGVVGLADANIRVTYVAKGPIIEKLLELWPKRETWNKTQEQVPLPVDSTKILETESSE